RLPRRRRAGRRPLRPRSALRHRRRRLRPRLPHRRALARSARAQHRRIVMGIGSGLLSPQGVGMLQQYFHGKLRGRAFGMFGTIVVGSVHIGPVLGGVLIAVLGDEWGWRSSSLITVPIALAGIGLGKIWLPKSACFGSGAEPDPRDRHRADFDPVGLVLLAFGTL